MQRVPQRCRFQSLIHNSWVAASWIERVRWALLCTIGRSWAPTTGNNGRRRPAFLCPSRYSTDKPHLTKSAGPALRCVAACGRGHWEYFFVLPFSSKAEPCNGAYDCRTNKHYSHRYSCYLARTLAESVAILLLSLDNGLDRCRRCRRCDGQCLHLTCDCLHLYDRRRRPGGGRGR